MLALTSWCLSFPVSEMAWVRHPPSGERFKAVPEVMDTAHGCDQAGLAGPPEHQACVECRERGMDCWVGVYITK